MGRISSTSRGTNWDCDNLLHKNINKIQLGKWAFLALCIFLARRLMSPKDNITVIHPKVLTGWRKKRGVTANGVDAVILCFENCVLLLILDPSYLGPSARSLRMRRNQNNRSLTVSNRWIIIAWTSPRRWTVKNQQFGHRRNESCSRQ